MEIQAQSGFTGMLGKAGLAIGNGSKLGAAFVTTASYGIKGVAYSKTGAATDIPMGALGIQADLTACIYLVQISANGTVTYKKGNTELKSGLTVSQPSVGLQIPSPDADNCPVGYVRMDTNGGTFTPGTTALDGTGCTATYVDFAGGMPDRPAAS